MSDSIIVTPKLKQPSFWLSILGAVGTIVHLVVGSNPIVSGVLAALTAALSAVDNITDASVDKEKIAQANAILARNQATDAKLPS